MLWPNLSRRQSDEKPRLKAELRVERDEKPRLKAELRANEKVLQGFVMIWEKQPSYLADSVGIVLAKRSTPLQSKIPVAKWTGRALACLKVYCVYDTFFAPPLSAGNYRPERTYRLKKCHHHASTGLVQLDKSGAAVKK
jgi:hypothetical protein